MAIKTFISVLELREALRETYALSKKVGFVPTMGALHEGHLSLFREVKSQCDYVVASIFVNPKQFGANEDFSSYPRTLKEDLAKLERLGVDAVFIPNAKEMYPDGFQTYVFNKDMSKVLCGQFRPDHFQGVLTVVMKLLNMVQPDIAIFGRKDYQQLQIIKTMVRDMNMPIEVKGADIVREDDGLAMSSRNVRIDESHRPEAKRIFEGLSKAKSLFNSGQRSVNALIEEFQASLSGSPFELQYAEIRDQVHLEEFAKEVDKPAVLAVAAFLGDVRLIDNIELG